MNIIAIDPSLISTAITINGKLFNYCKKENALTKKGELTKWFNMCSDFVQYRYIENTKLDDYSKNEVQKIYDYKKITDMMILDIQNNTNPTEDFKIGIEGYSYNSKNGDIIDLVTFSTILRDKLLNITKNLHIIAPTTLKLETCKFTYKAINIGKKKEILRYQNNEGIPGGKFTKKEMCKSIIENNNLNDDFSLHIKNIAEILMNNKKIEKPYDDLIDSFLIYTLKKNNIF